MSYKFDFSIIIPVYNAEKYIKQCIMSIINQNFDFDKVQVILVNDGSKDNSYAICKKYSDRYSNIIILNQVNKGVSIARNNGIKKALGKYILFLDADDYISSNTLITIHSFFEKNYDKVDIVTYPLKYIYNTGRERKHFRYSKLYQEKNYIYDINKNSELIQTTINYCVKNKMRNNIYFDRSYRIGEDEQYATKVLLNKQKIGYCNDCTYYYRMHNKNTISNFNITLKEFKMYVSYYKKILKEYPNNKYIINLALNNLRWRLEENKLIPYTENKNLESKMINSLKLLLELIDEQDIMKLSYLKVRVRLALLSLKSIDFKCSLSGDKVVVTTDKGLYKYNNKVLVNVEKITNKYIYGTIEMAFDLLENTNNLQIEYYPIYKNSYIDNVFELRFKYRYFSKKKVYIDEMLNHYPSYDIKLIRKDRLFNRYIVKNNIIYIKKQNLRNILVKIIKALGLTRAVKLTVDISISVLKKVLQKLRMTQYIILYKIFTKRYRLDNNKVLFLSASRDSLTGNFEFVSKELSKYKDIEVNKVLKKNLSFKYTFKEKIYLMKLVAKSKFILLDDFYPMIYALKLRKNQELIQLWHAMGAFKTVGYSRTGKNGGPDIKSLTHRNYTATIVSSENIRKNYSEAFGISINKVHPLGIPRTDIFFDKSYIKKITNKLEKKYPFIKNKKVVLFAPTFRGNGQKTAYYNYEWLDFDNIKKELSSEYIFIMKIHPFVKNKPNVIDNEFYFDLSDEREINDLLFITDILVTDYSSVIFEYSFFKKPVVFFIPDYREYIESRDFYYDFDKYMYGSTAKNSYELIKCIKKEKVNNKKIKEFNDFFCSACDGKSTKRVVEELIINKK